MFKMLLNLCNSSEYTKIQRSTRMARRYAFFDFIPCCQQDCTIAVAQFKMDFSFATLFSENIFQIQNIQHFSSVVWHAAPQSSPLILIDFSHGSASSLEHTKIYLIDCSIISILFKQFNHLAKNFRCKLLCFRIGSGHTKTSWCRLFLFSILQQEVLFVYLLKYSRFF